MQMTMERTVYVSEDGEVLREEIETKRDRYIPHTGEPDFIKLYIEAWTQFKGIKGVSTKVFVALLPYMTYADVSGEGGGQLIVLNAHIKRQICAELGYSSLKALDNELSKLTKEQVITRVGTGTYQVNPELVGRGNWHDIKALRATFHVIGPDAGKVTVEAD